MKNTYYNPAPYLHNQIPPTEIDKLFRKSVVKGIVHDENAFIMGGVSGHAGIFSNVLDIANYAQTMLNYGVYNGTRIFSKKTIRNAIKKQNLPIGSDYALGWDTPSSSGNSSAGDYFSELSYGHLGFTGTSMWIDPKKQLFIILLTNRTYPNRNKDGMHKFRRIFHNSIMEVILS